MNAFAALLASPHRRPILASAILVAGLGLVAVVVLLAWLGVGERADLLETRRFELQATAARVKARGPGLARAERTLAADPFLPGATATLAANGLQRRVVALAEDAGVTLQTIGAETATEVDAGELPHVTLQASAEAPIAAVQKLLYRLETETPFVLIDSVTIRGPQVTNDGGVIDPDPRLRVELRLIGFLHRAGS